MPLQTTGEIRLSQIATEFTDAAPHQMSEFYSAATGIPASGEISIADFYGTSAVNLRTASPVLQGGGIVFSGDPNAKTPTIRKTGGRYHCEWGPQHQPYEFDAVFLGGSIGFDLVPFPLPDGTYILIHRARPAPENDIGSLLHQIHVSADQTDTTNSRLQMSQPVKLEVGGILSPGINPAHNATNWPIVFDSWANLMVDPNNYNFASKMVQDGATVTCEWDWELNWDNFYRFYTLMDNTGVTAGTITIDGTVYNRNRYRFDAYRISQTRRTGANSTFLTPADRLSAYPLRTDATQYRLGMRMYSIHGNDANDPLLSNFNAGTMETNVAPYARTIFSDLNNWPPAGGSPIGQWTSLYLCLCQEGLTAGSSSSWLGYDQQANSFFEGFRQQPSGSTYYSANGIQFTNEITMTTGINYVNAYGFRPPEQEGGYD